MPGVKKNKRASHSSSSLNSPNTSTSTPTPSQPQSQSQPLPFSIKGRGSTGGISSTPTPASTPSPATPAFIPTPSSVPLINRIPTGPAALNNPAPSPSPNHPPTGPQNLRHPLPIPTQPARPGQQQQQHQGPPHPHFINPAFQNHHHRNQPHIHPQQQQQQHSPSFRPPGFPSTPQHQSLPQPPHQSQQLQQQLQQQQQRQHQRQNSLRGGIINRPSLNPTTPPPGSGPAGSRGIGSPGTPTSSNVSPVSGGLKAILAAASRGPVSSSPSSKGTTAAARTSGSTTTSGGLKITSVPATNAITSPSLSKATSSDSPPREPSPTPTLKSSSSLVGILPPPPAGSTPPPIPAFKKQKLESDSEKKVAQTSLGARIEKKSSQGEIVVIPSSGVSGSFNSGSSSGKVSTTVSQVLTAVTTTATNTNTLVPSPVPIVTPKPTPSTSASTSISKPTSAPTIKPTSPSLPPTKPKSSTSTTTVTPAAPAISSSSSTKPTYAKTATAPSNSIAPTTSTNNMSSSKPSPQSQSQPQSQKPQQPPQSSSPQLQAKPPPTGPRSQQQQQQQQPRDSQGLLARMGTTGAGSGGGGGGGGGGDNRVVRLPLPKKPPFPIASTSKSSGRSGAVSVSSTPFESLKVALKEKLDELLHQKKVEEGDDDRTSGGDDLKAKGKGRVASSGESDARKGLEGENQHREDPSAKGIPDTISKSIDEFKLRWLVGKKKSKKNGGDGRGVKRKRDGGDGDEEKEKEGEEEENGVVKEAKKAVVERELESWIGGMARHPSDPVTLQHALDIVLAFTDKEIVEPSLPIQTLESIFEVSTIAESEKLFTWMERRRLRLTADISSSSSNSKSTAAAQKHRSLVLLRLLNDLLRRLSKSIPDTVLAGRILLYLSGVFPLGERSGVNLGGGFNERNGTEWDVEWVEAMKTEREKREKEAKEQEEKDRRIKEEQEEEERKKREEDEKEKMAVDATGDNEKKPSTEAEGEEISEKTKEKDKEEESHKEPEKKKDSTPAGSDPEFYRMFWSMQKYFSNPPLLTIPGPEPPQPPTTGQQQQSQSPQLPKSNLALFRESASKVLRVFKEQTKREREMRGASEREKMERERRRREEERVKRDAEREVGTGFGPISGNGGETRMDVDVPVDAGWNGEKKKLDKGDGLSEEEVERDYFFFPKYLTGRNLLELEIGDVYFRRQVLIQIIIIFQYMRSFTPAEKKKVVGLKNPNKSMHQLSFVLPEEDDKWITMKNREIMQELKDTLPDGDKFVKTVTLIMTREKNWIHWKAANCQPIERPPIPQSKFVEAKQKQRKLLDIPRPYPWALGTPQLTRLWEGNQKRKGKVLGAAAGGFERSTEEHGDGGEGVREEGARDRMEIDGGNGKDLVMKLSGAGRGTGVAEKMEKRVKEKLLQYKSEIDSLDEELLDQKAFLDQAQSSLKESRPALQSAETAVTNRKQQLTSTSGGANGAAAAGKGDSKAYLTDDEFKKLSSEMERCLKRVKKDMESIGELEEKVKGIEEHKASLAWRALRVASPVYLRHFTKIGSGDISKLVKEIQEEERSVKLKERDAKKSSKERDRERERDNKEKDSKEGSRAKNSTGGGEDTEMKDLTTEAIPVSSRKGSPDIVVLEPSKSSPPPKAGSGGESPTLITAAEKESSPSPERRHQKDEAIEAEKDKEKERRKDRDAERVRMESSDDRPRDRDRDAPESRKPSNASSKTGSTAGSKRARDEMEFPDAEEDRSSERGGSSGRRHGGASPEKPSISRSERSSRRSSGIATGKEERKPSATTGDSVSRDARESKRRKA